MAAANEGTFESSDATGRQKHREPSVDGLLRDCSNGEGRVGSGPLAGSALEDYIIGKQIGQGAYATVFFGLHRDSGKKVAIKIYEKYKLLDPQRRKSVRCEIRLMERLRHPNIVIFHDALDTPKQIYIIMDFVGGGSLHHFLKKRPGRRLDDQVAKRIIFQVAQGIKYLHDRHIVHRDIKLENLLLDDNNTVKIIDFGFSTIVPPGKRLKIFCGTPSYMAPEIVARKEYTGFCADIWAMGVLLYALLCGSFPFRGQNDRDLYRKIVRGVFHIPECVTDGARNLLNRALTADMARRPTIDDSLADPWFSSHRDDLYASQAKGSITCYQPNTSTSSTATTAAPSSSAGQSARETSGEAPAPPSHVPSASRMSAALSAPNASSTAIGAVSARNAGAAAVTQASARNCVVDAWGAVPCAEDATAAGGVIGGSESTDFVGTRPQKLEEVSERAVRIDSRCSRQFEEEAISKLERLGYPRDEIIRQLKDESSHLCKLYNRFLKALTAWDSKK
jgi:serine/threonine protein kinase